MSTVTCALGCGVLGEIPHDGALAFLWSHYETEHDPANLGEVHQLPTVTFREQALAAIRTLAATRKPFTIGEARPLVTVQPVNPRTEWAAVTREAVSLGLIRSHGFAKSVVPTTKSSAVTEWIGTGVAA